MKSSPYYLSSIRAATSRAIPFTVIFLFLLCSAAYGQSVPGFQAPDKPRVKDDTPLAVKAARGEVPFSRKYGHLKPGSTNTKRLGPLSPGKQKKQTHEKFLRIGVVRPLLTPLDPLADSALYTVTEGDIRVAGLVSEGAVAVRVQFKEMSLPPGARVFVYSLSNPDQYYGPYVGRGASEDGTFWTPPIRGDTAVIEYFAPPKSNAAKTPFKVFSIAHVYKDLSDQAAAFCELEVTADWQNVAKSVGRVDFVSEGFVGICTGTLLNDVANDQKPYFLTANHCISTQAEAQSVTVYWNYNTGDSPPGGTPTTHGANLLSTGVTNDFSLLFLTGSLPGGLFFAGWDTTRINGTAAATGIHHPEGSHKRISFGTAAQPNGGNCPGRDCLRVDWSSGVTEPGSSGSGLWIGNPSDPGGPRLIGTLIGGISACGNDPSGMWDVYGRFSVAYPSIAAFLEGTACVTSLSSTSQSFTGAGGSGSFNVTSDGSCNWTAVPSESFVTITSTSNGGVNGTVNFSVASNNGPQRSATILVGGKIFTITQSGGGPCEPSPIGIGQTVNGNLTTNDCPLGDGTFYDTYTFTGTAGQRIAVSMTSSEFDTFLFLRAPDGSLISANDDGGGGTNSRIPPGSNNFLTLPVTGTYSIWANALSPDDTTGAYSVTVSLPVPRTLTVASSNPDSGVTIGVGPADNNGLSSGTTQFTRTYDHFTTLTLSAPSNLGPDVIFLKWQKNGVDWTTATVTVLTMDADYTVTAVYGPVPNFVLTVASTNPSSGVPIEVSPNDNGGSGNGTTQFTRTYRQGRLVTLKAPINAGGNNYFQKWQENGVDVTTSRTINVVTNNNLTMTAVYFTIPPTPTPTPTPTAPGQAVAYQINPAHTGSQIDTVNPPLTQRWSRDLGNSVSYPLIAGGKVFVVAGTSLYGLNLTNGATVWGPIDLGGVSRGLAYDSNRVFAVNQSGLLRAFDAGTGGQVWSRQLSGQTFTSPPTAMGGTVYVSGFSTLHAVSAQDGTVNWSTPNAGGFQSSPAVTTGGVFVSYSCNNSFALAPATGAVIWHNTPPCFGPGGRTTVFYNGRLYTRDTSILNFALDSSTGITVAEYQAGPAPAFHGSTGFFLVDSTLQARDITSGTVKWSFTGDGNLSSAPIVVNGTVYIGSTGGKLFALDGSTGANVWTGTVGAPVNRPDEHNSSQPLTGLGAGEGLIVVPASNLLVAYEAAPAPPPVIYAEEGTNNAVALDSVTFVRSPFRLSNPNNFSIDQRTRIILLTSNLGLTQSDLSDPSVLVVELAGINLPVENVGALSIPGLSSSYIVVRIPDNVPTGVQELRIKLRGVTSEPRLLNVSP